MVFDYGADVQVDPLETHVDRYALTANPPSFAFHDIPIQLIGTVSVFGHFKGDDPTAFL
jgi:hypothetical protein